MICLVKCIYCAILNTVFYLYSKHGSLFTYTLTWYTHLWIKKQTNTLHIAHMAEQMLSWHSDTYIAVEDLFHNCGQVAFVSSPSISCDWFQPRRIMRRAYSWILCWLVYREHEILVMNAVMQWILMAFTAVTYHCSRAHGQEFRYLNILGLFSPVLLKGIIGEIINNIYEFSLKKMPNYKAHAESMQVLF